MTEETRGVRIGLAAVAGCIGATGLYAVLRLVQRLLIDEPDPALIIWSEHAGYFWRAWTAAYAGGMIAFITYVAAGKNAPRTATVLAKALPIVALVAAAQSLLVP